MKGLILIAYEYRFLRTHLEGQDFGEVDIRFDSQFDPKDYGRICYFHPTPPERKAYLEQSRKENRDPEQSFYLNFASINDAVKVLKNFFKFGLTKEVLNSWLLCLIDYEPKFRQFEAYGVSFLRSERSDNDGFVNLKYVLKSYNADDWINVFPILERSIEEIYETYLRDIIPKDKVYTLVKISDPMNILSWGINTKIQETKVRTQPARMLA